jgi:hypothetical protein
LAAAAEKSRARRNAERRSAGRSGEAGQQQARIVGAIRGVARRASCAREGATKEREVERRSR